MAFSIALTLGGRPTSSEIDMYGNTTTSRSGNSGRRSGTRTSSSPRRNSSAPAAGTGVAAPARRAAGRAAGRRGGRDGRDVLGVLGFGTKDWDSCRPGLEKLRNGRRSGSAARVRIMPAGLNRVGSGFLAPLLALAAERQERRRAILDALLRDRA